MALALKTGEIIIEELIGEVTSESKKLGRSAGSEKPGGSTGKRGEMEWALFI